MLRRWASTRSRSTAWKVLSRPNFNRRTDGVLGQRRSQLNCVCIRQGCCAHGNGSLQLRRRYLLVLCSTVQKRFLCGTPAGSAFWPRQRGRAETDNRYNACATVHRGEIHGSKSRPCQRRRCARSRCGCSPRKKWRCRTRPSKRCSARRLRHDVRHVPRPQFRRRPARRAAQGRRVHAQVRRQTGTRAVRRHAHDDADGQPRLAARGNLRSARGVAARAERDRRRRDSAAGRPAVARRDADSRRRLQLHGVLAVHGARRRRPADAAGRLQRRHRRLHRRAAGRRLARLAPQLRRARFQPVARDRHAQRPEPAPRVELDDAGRQRGRRTARARRHDLRPSLRRHRAGARREDRRPALAVHAHARARRLAVPQARHRAARRPALPRHVGRARRRARRRRRRSRLGHEGRRLPPARRPERRPARRARQSHGRHDGHRRRRENRRAADRRPRRGDRRGSVAPRHDRETRRARRRELERHPVRRAQRRVDLDARQLRPVDGPRLLRHGQHVRHGPAAEAERAGHHERRAVHELDAWP